MEIHIYIYVYVNFFSKNNSVFIVLNLKVKKLNALTIVVVFKNNHIKNVYLSMHSEWLVSNNCGLGNEEGFMASFKGNTDRVKLNLGVNLTSEMENVLPFYSMTHLFGRKKDEEAKV